MWVDFIRHEGKKMNKGRSMTCFKETNDRNKWMIMFTIAKELTPPTFTCKKKKKKKIPS